jgi:hypothetical protein
VVRLAGRAPNQALHLTAAQSGRGRSPCARRLCSGLRLKSYRIDGPFTETKELIAGFSIWKVSSLQEAIDWVKRCPNCMIDDYDVEIRPLFGPEDFATELPRQQELQARLISGLE